MKKILFILLLLPFIVSANNYYVSPTGNDSNTGIIGSPFKSLTKASTVLAARPLKGAGDTVFVRGGTYNGFPGLPANGYAQLLINNIKGTALAPCVFMAYQNEKPVFDFTGVVVNPTRPSPTGLSVFSSNYIKFKGFRLTGYNQIADGSGVSRGFELNGCNQVTIENCEVDHFQGTGFFISGGTFDVLYKDCDSHHNEDPLSADGSGVPGSDAYDNADGFGITGVGNTSDRITFDGCQAYLNCDDGWDNFGTNGARKWIRCRAFLNGYRMRSTDPFPVIAGNGQGFKLGPCGSDMTGTDDLRVLENCIAYDNRAHGFDQNGEVTTRMKLLNCVAYRNGGYGYQFQYYSVNPGGNIAHTIKNCISFANGQGSPSGVNLASAIPSGVTNNSWQNGLVVNSADFQGLDTTNVWVRQADGSLSNTAFLHLVANSDLRNAGTPVGIVFCDTNPDLGAYEFCSGIAVPTANAGSDQTITLPINQVTLSGSATTTGTISAWFWRGLTFPSPPTITNPSLQTTTATGLVQGVYKFELKVTDNTGQTDVDTMQVTVNAAPATNPTCNAGTAATITLPVNQVSLTGTGASTSGNGVTYAWTQSSGTTVVITNANTASATATFTIAGSYSFLLTVTDNVNGLTCTSIKNVTVNAAVVAPTANAGSDQQITLPTNTVTLTGSGTGGSGTITGYGWVKLPSSPSAGTIANPTNSSTAINSMVQGIYKFELTVTASTGLTAKDTVQVTVLPAANIPPVANAGVDKTITLPVNTVSITGSGTDADGTLTVYLWTILPSSPVTGSLTSTTTTTTSLINLVQGVYKVQLQVTDNNGATDLDTMQVTVNAAPITPPTCSTNGSATITLPTNSAALVMNAVSTTGGSISSYGWVKTSGPATGTIQNAALASTQAINLVQGTYVFTGTAADNNAQTCTTVKTITVNPAPNVGPTANAGADQNIQLPTSSVTLSGSGTDPDGTITAYSWVKISGPGVGTITSPSSASTTVTGLTTIGVYKYELTVTDNNSATGKDTMQVTVVAAANVPPTANAGPDQTITLPTNSVSLPGSGTDTDGTIVSYGWTKISGPSTGGLTSTNTPTTSANNLVQGTYQFQLTVTDNNGATATDVVQIVVNAAIVIAPTANAGSDKVITIPVNSAALNGSGTGTGISYLWTKITGPSTFAITNNTSAVTDATGLVEGEYTFELKVINVASQVARDTMKITVNGQVGPPVVNAGKDTVIQLPTSSVTLTGTVIYLHASAGTIAWTQVSGPNTATIGSASSLTSSFSGLIAGVYKFRLDITDTNLFTSFGEVTVTVLAADVPQLTNVIFFSYILNKKKEAVFSWTANTTTNSRSFLVQRKGRFGYSSVSSAIQAKVDIKDYKFIDTRTPYGSTEYVIKIQDGTGVSYSKRIVVKKN